MFEKVYKQLKFNFIIALAVVVFHVFLGWFLSKNFEHGIAGNYATILKTFVVLYVLISIPITLKFFNQKLKKLANITNQKAQEEEYIKVSGLRISVILAGLTLAIMCYFIEDMQDMLYLVAIEVAVLILCIPTKKRVQSEIDIFTNQNEEI